MPKSTDIIDVNDHSPTPGRTGSKVEIRGFSGTLTGPVTFDVHLWKADESGEISQAIVTLTNAEFRTAFNPGNSNNDNALKRVVATKAGFINKP